MNDGRGLPAAVTPETVDRWERDFTQDGFVMLPGLLSPEEVATLRDGVVQAHQSPCPTGTTTPLHRHQMFRRGPRFAAMLDRPPIVDLAERILGDTGQQEAIGPAGSHVQRDRGAAGHIDRRDAGRCRQDPHRT